MKKSVVLLSTSALFLSLFTGGLTGFAAPSNLEGTSQGEIEFDTDNTATPPIVDPENPNKPGYPFYPPTGNKGPLSLDYASSLRFGKVSISSADQYYKVQPEKMYETEAQEKEIEKPNFIQLTDNRGTFEGWRLLVKQEKQFETADKHELVGAEIQVKNAAVDSETESSYAPSTVKSAINFVPGESHLLASAKANQGMGTWVYRFGNDASEASDAIELFVPGKAVKKKEQYKTNLHWEVLAGPAEEAPAP